MTGGECNKHAAAHGDLQLGAAGSSGIGTYSVTGTRRLFHCIQYPCPTQNNPSRWYFNTLDRTFLPFTRETVKPEPAAAERPDWIAKEGLCVCRHRMRPVHLWVQGENCFVEGKRDTQGELCAGQKAVWYMSTESKKY